MKRVIFGIAYDGPAVDDGIMDVKELAPALLALGDLIENSNQTVGDPDTKIKVVVRSSFEKGSFQVTLEMVYSLAEQVKMYFDLQGADSLVEKLPILIGLVSGAGLSLIKLIKWLNGRNIKSVTVLENGKMRLELSGDNGKFDYIEVDEKVIRLFRNRDVRENLRRMLSPLEKLGINGFSVRKGKETIERISKDEINLYEVPDPQNEEQSIITVRRTFVNLIEVAFEEGLKWRLSDGDNKFYATIADEDFLKQMETDKTFAKGDILEVELETTQIATPKGGIKNEHMILKVINHLTRPQQLPLPFGYDDKK